MKTRLLSILAIAAGLTVGGIAVAAEATPEAAASGPKLTKAERKAAAKERRAKMAKAQKSGELATSEQDKAAPAKKVTAADKAERAAKRAENAKDNKAGAMPTTNEAGTKK